MKNVNFVQIVSHIDNSNNLLPPEKHPVEHIFVAFSFPPNQTIKPSRLHFKSCGIKKKKKGGANNPDSRTTCAGFEPGQTYLTFKHVGPSPDPKLSERIKH